MLKVKYTYKYPLSAPVDRLALQVQRDEKIPDTIAMYQTVQKTLTAKKYIDTEKNMWVVEAEVTEEFDAFTAVLKDVPRDGLVGEWLFFEGSGTTLHDTSGQGNNGTIYGMTFETLPTGKVVGSFDGVDDYVSVPDSPSLNVETTNELTVIAWILKTTDVYPQFVVRKGYGTTNSFHLGIGIHNKLRIDYYNGGDFVLEAPYVFTPYVNKWTLIGATVSDTTVKLWINGNTVASAQKTLSLKEYNQPIQISGWGTIRLFKGFIGIVRIYNRALSETEFKEIYTLEAPLFGITP